jgi:hypothetical protein
MLLLTGIEPPIVRPVATRYTQLFNFHLTTDILIIAGCTVKIATSHTRRMIIETGRTAPGSHLCNVEHKRSAHLRPI